MRVLLALLLLSPVLAGCTPFIPVKDDFGTSALTPVSPSAIPPEFAEFNNYDPAVNPLLAQQLCATAYEPLQTRNEPAATGTLSAQRGRCKTHVPLFGSLW